MINKSLETCSNLKIDLDKFLNSQERLTDEELTIEDYNMIDKLMNHIQKVKGTFTHSQEGTCSLNPSRKLTFECKQTFHSVPLDEECVRLNENDEDSKYSGNEYFTSQALPPKMVTTKSFNLVSPLDDIKKNEYKFYFDTKYDTQLEFPWSTGLGKSIVQEKPQVSAKVPIAPFLLNEEKKEEDIISNTKDSSTYEENSEQKSHPKQQQLGKPRQMLSLRTDVMNKNLFRALRRECKSMFESYLNSEDNGTNTRLCTGNLSNTKKQKLFTARLEQFSQNLLDTTTANWRHFEEFDPKSFETYLGIFANYCAMKKIIKKGKARDKLDKVYSVLYTYSHIKFNEFMTIPEIQILVKIICERSGKESLIRGNSTLCVNAESYKAHIDRLLRSFN